MRFREHGKINVKDDARECKFQRRKEARPGELVRAALDAFVEKGFAATRLEDVATKAGVSKGTIYLYFASKEVLFKAVIEAGMAPAKETIEALSASSEKLDRPATELLRGSCEAWQHVMRETPMANALKLLIAESGNFPEVVHWFADSVERPAKTLTINILEAGIARGDFRPIPIEIAADIFFSLMWQCALDKIGGGLPSPERFLEEAFEVLTRGLVKVPTN